MCIYVVYVIRVVEPEKEVHKCVRIDITSLETS
jgi:hypothetical protein